MAKFNLESLRIPQDLEPATRLGFRFIHLRKPGKRAFIRTSLVPARTETYSLVEDFEGELYIATDHEARDGGLDAGKLRPVLKGDGPPPKRADAMGNTKESQAGAFPRRIQLGPDRVSWVKEEVEAWPRERIEDRGTA